MKTSNVSDLMVLKNARLENARVRGRGSESATAREKSRSLALALSRVVLPTLDQRWANIDIFCISLWILLDL